jgi:gamma-glutamyltranspeptidase/glutathione hydrolase
MPTGEVAEVLSYVNTCLIICALTVFVVLQTPVKLYSYGVEPVCGRNGMVSSANEIASRIGVDVLAKGGNAVDAAVAVGFALAVVHPQAGNVGGGGFMMIRESGSGNVYAVDYRETAPSAATRDMYLKPDGTVDNDASQIGYLAVGVPGTVKGLSEVHKKLGTMKWEELIRPAVQLAENGFKISYQQAQSLNSYKEFFVRFPSSGIFICPENRDWEPGDLLIQKDLAKTLRRIAEYGPDEFYTGETSRKIASSVRNGGGIISAEDLAKYTVKWREPLTGEFLGNRIYGMPLPSSGTVVLLEALNVFKQFPLKEYGQGSADFYHLFVETLRRVFRDRSLYMGDTDFVKVPLNELLSPEHAKKLAAQISMEKATDSKTLERVLPLMDESENTTHFTTADKWGNVVSNTYTLNSSYGSKVVADGTGILLNNEMDDFSLKAGASNQFDLIESEANAISPGKRMLSSMTPLIIVKEGEYVMTMGSPGGPMIISSVLQTLLNVVVFDMNIQEAVNAPRIHHQWLPDEVKMEKYGFAPEVRKQLESRGHKLTERKYMGDVQVIIYMMKSGLLMGASDPRSEGRSVGY